MRFYNSNLLGQDCSAITGAKPMKKYRVKLIWILPPDGWIKVNMDTFAKHKHANSIMAARKQIGVFIFLLPNAWLFRKQWYWQFSKFWEDLLRVILNWWLIPYLIEYLFRERLLILWRNEKTHLKDIRIDCYRRVCNREPNKIAKNAHMQRA